MGLSPTALTKTSANLGASPTPTGGERGRVGRIDALDVRPLNLDGVLVVDAELGLTAMASPFDPEPSLVLAGGRLLELDGRPREQFDPIDASIAERAIDLDIAEEAMAIDDVQLARMICELAVARNDGARVIAEPLRASSRVALLRPAPHALNPDARDESPRRPLGRAIA